MSFLTFIQSKQGAQVIELYRFTDSGSNVYFYASYSKDIVINDVVYKKIIAQHGNVVNSTRVGQNNVDITVAKNSEIINRISDSDRATWTVEIQLVNLGDTDIATIFKGKITTIKHDKRRYTLKCEPLVVNTRYLGLGMSYQPICPYLLYGDLCRVSSAGFSAAMTVSGVTGSIIQFTNNLPNASGYYVGGYVSIGSDNFTSKQIVGQGSNQVTVRDTSLPLSIIGKAATVYAGCDKTFDTCKNKFNNLVNYGGYNYVPFVNYWRGNQIG